MALLGHDLGERGPAPRAAAVNLPLTATLPVRLAGAPSLDRLSIEGLEAKGLPCALSFAAIRVVSEQALFDAFEDLGDGWLTDAERRRDLVLRVAV